jgi:hypothetical protein
VFEPEQKVIESRTFLSSRAFCSSLVISRRSFGKLNDVDPISAEE